MNARASVLTILTSIPFGHQGNDEDHAGTHKNDATNESPVIIRFNSWGYEETSTHYKKNPTKKIPFPL